MIHSVRSIFCNFASVIKLGKVRLNNLNICQNVFRLKEMLDAKGY